jgi:hypothetical protein
MWDLSAPAVPVGVILVLSELVGALGDCKDLENTDDGVLLVGDLEIID